MLSVDNLSISSGPFHLHGITFSIEPATCLTLMGPSGSGKTTIMEAICGLRCINAGRIISNQREVTHLPPAARNFALVPQDNVLFSHLTVRENLAFGPTIQKWSRDAIQSRIISLADNLGLTALLDRSPAQLSGGEAKRVALGRALATQPALLCLDEALTGLDETTHTETLALIKNTIKNEQTTTLHITHSSHEAEKLADNILHISDILPKS